jgi:putative transposase
MNKAHSIQLIPTKAQKMLLHKSFGIARHSFNWALDAWKKQYKRGKKPSATSLIKLQNSIKKKAFPFYKEVSKTAPQYAIWNVEAAYKNMWKEKSGYPKFKKKGVKDSFVAVENKNQFKQQNKKIRLPRIGWVKCHEDLRFEGKINNVVVKRIADKYFAVVNLISNETPAVSENQAAVGVDLGIKSLLVLSDGKTFENPKALKKNLKSLNRLQRGLSRKKKGSNNRKKQKMKVAKKYYRISNIRKNAIHQATSYLVNNYGKIVIEDLNVKAMVKNRKLSQALSDASFGEISRQLAYKAAWNGVELVKADRFFASSKTCCNCGNKKEKLKLSERIYKCRNCGIEIDRDFNAAKNLANYSPTQKSCGSQACGDGSEPLVQRTSMKQELLFNTIKF